MELPTKIFFIGSLLVICLAAIILYWTRFELVPAGVRGDLYKLNRLNGNITYIMQGKF